MRVPILFQLLFVPSYLGEFRRLVNTVIFLRFPNID